MVNKMSIEPRKLTYSDICFNKDRINFQQKMINCDHWQCCQNCVHLDKMFEGMPCYCSLFNAVPPVHVIVVGCENWQYEIPF